MLQPSKENKKNKQLLTSLSFATAGVPLQWNTLLFVSLFQFTVIYRVGAMDDVALLN